MNDSDEKPTLWQAIGSVLAAFFGVQKRANRERDFTRGNPVHFIIVGLLMTAAFIGVVILAVQLALSRAA